jgi:anti-anti-sigma regulatory factor
MEIIKDPSGTLVLKGQMITSQIEAIHSKIEPLIDEILPEAAFDLSEITEIDIAGLQLILALKKTIESEGSFQIRALSPPVKECIMLAGFDMLLKEVV